MTEKENVDTKSKEYFKLNFLLDIHLQLKTTLQLRVPVGRLCNTKDDITGAKWLKRKVKTSLEWTKYKLLVFVVIFDSTDTLVL